MLPAPVAACLYNLFFQPQPARKSIFLCKFASTVSGTDYFL